MTIRSSATGLSEQQDGDHLVPDGERGREAEQVGIGDGLGTELVKSRLAGPHEIENPYRLDPAAFLDHLCTPFSGLDL